MVSSQDLVPTGQPYGSRKDTVAAMQAANVPTSSEGAGGPVAAPATASTPAPSTFSMPPPSLDNFDVLAARQPTPDFTPPAARQVLKERVRQSDNQVLQSIFQRMTGYKDG